MRVERHRVAGEREWHVNAPGFPGASRLKHDLAVDGPLTPVTSMDSLPTVFRRALLNLSKASNLPTIQDETQVFLFISDKRSIAELVGQELIDTALKDCRDSRARVADLALFSPNETLDDISTQDLVYLLLPYVSAEIEGRARAIERDERLSRLGAAKVRHPCPPLTDEFLLYGQQGFTKFVSDLESYEIVSKSEHELHGKNASAIADPARRRETKIKQYQAEKDIRTRIEVNSSVQIFYVRPCETSFRPSRHGIVSLSHPPTPPRPTLTSSPRYFHLPRPHPPQSVTRRKTRTNGVQRRFSCSGSPTLRRTHNSRVSPRNLNCCSARRPRHHYTSPECQITHARRARRSVHYGLSMRPALLARHNVAGHC